ncbi:MAG: metallophosphoesterase [Kiritimatiellae bacterium]|nr:metallophosphoesterase [Kiritimatiellia bacterium]
MAGFAFGTGVLMVALAVLPLRAGVSWKLLLAAAALLVAFKFQVMHKLGGPNFFAPDLPAWLQLAAAFLHAAFLIFLAGLLLLGVVQGALLLFRVAGLSFYLRAEAVLLCLAVLAAAVGIRNGISPPVPREHAFRCANLPPEAEGFRIALLADIHADCVTRADRVAEMVALANGMDADVAVIAGDFADGPVAKAGAELAPLKDLRARYGVYGVSGNHEYYSGDAEWRDFLETLGVKMLDNASTNLPCGIVVAGVADLAAWHNKGKSPPDFDAALCGVQPGACTVMLAHQPVLARMSAKRGVAVQLSGHTHGGMMLGLKQLVARFNGGWVSGAYDVEGMGLYVSNGSGIWNGFPVRLFCPPEVTLITLSGRK